MTRFACGLALALTLTGCSGPPQMGGDKEVFGAVDALYTAVTAKRTDLLDRSEQKLTDLRATVNCRFAARISKPGRRL